MDQQRKIKYLKKTKADRAGGAEEAPTDGD